MKNYIIRNPIGSDFNFIESKFKQGLYYGNRGLRQFPKEYCDELLNKVFNDVITKKEVVIKVASFEEDPEVCIGCSIYEGTTLHWVCVIPCWQSMGIATDLVPKNIEFYSLCTDTAFSIIRQSFLPIERQNDIRRKVSMEQDRIIHQVKEYKPKNIKPKFYFPKEKFT